MPAAGLLTSLETGLRRAVLADSFAEIRRLLDQYGAAVEQQAKTLPPASAELDALRERAWRLLEWAGALLRTSRAHVAAELSHARSLGRYGNQAGGRPWGAQG